MKSHLNVVITAGKHVKMLVVWLQLWWMEGSGGDEREWGVREGDEREGERMRGKGRG